MAKRRNAEPTQGRPVPKRLDHMSGGISVWGGRWTPVKKADSSSPAGECTIFSATGETSSLALEHPQSTSAASGEVSSRRNSARQRTSGASSGAASRSGTSASLHPSTAATYVPGGVLHSSPNLGHATLAEGAASPGYPPLAVTPSPGGRPGWDNPSGPGAYASSPWPQDTPYHPSFASPPQAGQYGSHQSGARQYSPSWSGPTSVEQAYLTDDPSSYPHGMVGFDGASYGHDSSWALPIANDMSGDLYVSPSPAIPQYDPYQNRHRVQTWAPATSPPPLPPMPVHAATVPSPNTPMEFYAHYPQGYPSPGPSSASSGSFTQNRQSAAAVGGPQEHVPRISGHSSRSGTYQTHSYPQSAPGPSPPRR